MARIRTIKPEFPQSESIGALSRDARLLFIQLWTVVDDDGRARAAPRMLASLLYPYDDDAPKLIDGWLNELESSGHIRRYVVDGSNYLDIPNFLKHQKIDKPSKSRLPEYSENHREPSRTLATYLVPSTSTEDQKVLSEPSSDTRKRITYPEDFEGFWRAYPTDANMSKKEAFDAWKRLPPEDKAIAVASIPNFKAFCAKDPTYRPIHACRYLAKRRFEGHGPGELGPEATAEREQFMRSRGYDWDETAGKWVQETAA